MALWSALAALGVGYGAWLLTRHQLSALLSAGLYICLAPYTDSLDINYGAWMITPYVWAFALMLKAMEQSRLSWWFCAGAMMTLAALCKRQGAVLAPLFALAAFSASRAGVRGALRPVMAAALGSVLAFTPMTLWYQRRGALSAWVDSYLLSRSGWEYVKGGGQGALSTAEIGLRVGDGLLGVWEFCRAPLCLALVATALYAGRLKRERDGSGWRLLLLWALCLMSFVGASLGWRYFKGYYLQLLPGLLWLGALGLSSALQRASWRELSPSRWALLSCVSLSLLLPLSRDLNKSLEARARRERPLYLPTYEVQRVTAWIKARRRAGDSLWVWGRWGWPLYHFTGLMSPTRYYKSLGVLTTQLTNTWNPARRGAPVRFNPESGWAEAIEELKSRPPRFIVIARNEDWRDFKALKALLAERYRRAPQSELKLLRPKSGVFEAYELR